MPLTQEGWGGPLSLGPKARAGRNPEMTDQYPPRTRPKPAQVLVPAGRGRPAAHVAGTAGYDAKVTDLEERTVPSKSANVKNVKQYEALKDKGMSKKKAGRKGGKASHG